MTRFSTLSRREAIKAGALTGAGVALAGWSFPEVRAEGAAEIITRAIPSTGEKIPILGVGTNAYGVTDPAEIAARKEVLKRLPEFGASVVDTAPSYGKSEEVIGRIVKELGNRAKLFLATKLMARNGNVEQGKAEMARSLELLHTDRIDLMQVHNLMGTDALMPFLLEQKQARRIRYIGITTSADDQHAEMRESMLKHPLDFIQVNYSIDDREAEAEVLPAAQDRGIAVLLNMPFGGRRGGNLFQRVAGRELPPWAKEFGATSWAQFFLKFVLSHPAVTCAIPGMTKVSHLEDNIKAAQGVMPDAAMRKRMVEFWSSLS